MIVFPREICRDISSAMAREWLIRNSTGTYAAATITGALTRRQHGLLVARRSSEQIVMLAKLDEELEVDGRIFKLATNEYLTNVINPDGFLYLQQVTFNGVMTHFVFEAGRFQLTKSVWVDPTGATTYIRYALAEHSARARLTLLPLCDYRSTDRITQGNETWHFQIENLPRGIRVTASEGATPYRLLTNPAPLFTPLDLWYWRFQLRAEQDAGLDLFVPGLFRHDLSPGESCTLIATAEQDDAIDFDVARAFQAAVARAPVPMPAAPDAFSPDVFTQLG